MRDIIALACQDCKRRNYSTTKNKKKTTERLEFSKYCRFCRKHTAHKHSDDDAGQRERGGGRARRTLPYVPH
jgi:large subunit ribosomal protein L33